MNPYPPPIVFPTISFHSLFNRENVCRSLFFEIEIFLLPFEIQIRKIGGQMSSIIYFLSLEIDFTRNYPKPKFSSLSTVKTTGAKTTNIDSVTCLDLQNVLIIFGSLLTTFEAFGTVSKTGSRINHTESLINKFKKFKKPKHHNQVKLLKIRVTPYWSI